MAIPEEKMTPHLEQCIMMAGISEFSLYVKFAEINLTCC